MNQGVSLVKVAQVIDIDDSADGLRIKAKLEQDKNNSDIPWALPLLPKTFQSVPKKGESVLIITAMSNNKQSQRFYIGPLISQRQNQQYDEYDYGRGSAASLLQGGFIAPEERMSNFPPTAGSFPNVNDVAVVGRGGEDIILKENENKGSEESEEIDIRCGIRREPIQPTNDFKGKIVFNEEDPAYLQLKYKKGLTKSITPSSKQFDEQEGSSAINIVADKINIISHKDNNKHNLTDRDTLINENELSEIMEKLHEVPYGDLLVKFLDIFVTAFLTHVHPLGGMSPSISSEVLSLINENANIDKIISKNVRIS